MSNQIYEAIYNFKYFTEVYCPSFKYETQVFKTSKKDKMRRYIWDQIHTKLS